MGEKYYLSAQQRPHNYPNCRCEIVKRQNNHTEKKTSNLTKSSPCLASGLVLIYQPINTAVLVFVSIELRVNL